jgi:hypothetical protein
MGQTLHIIQGDTADVWHATLTRLRHINTKRLCTCERHGAAGSFTCMRVNTMRACSVCGGTTARVGAAVKFGGGGHTISSCAETHCQEHCLHCTLKDAPPGQHAHCNLHLWRVACTRTGSICHKLGGALCMGSIMAGRCTMGNKHTVRTG